MPSHTAAQIAAQCAGSRQQGEGWQAQCPAHEDTHASLSIHDGDKGVVLYCHAGCAFEAIIGALGVAAGDLRQSNGHMPTPRRRIAATYDYIDAHGTLLFQTVRYEPKDFRQRRPHPDYADEWIFNLKGLELVLYRLPEVLAAQRVFVTEGEKDADTLHALGYVATTAPMGAGKWKPQYTEALRDKDVVIVPDNDAPGRQHAARIVKALQGIVRSCVVVHIPGENKSDVSDWVDEGHTADELEALLAAALTAPPRHGKGRTREKAYSPEGTRNLRYHLIDAPPPGAQDPEAWRARLILDKEGRPRESLGNVALLLAHLPEARDLWWNAFAMQNMWGNRALTDDDVVHFAVLLQETFELSLNRIANLHRCIHLQAKRQARDPLREYVEQLMWDGRPRLATWLHDFLGADDTPVNAWVGTALCCAMVARALTPGCQCRYVVILEGPENAGKSRACAILGSPWHDAITSGFDHKETIIAMRGTWVLEVEELNAMRKSEESAVKAFVTRTHDRVVLKFANEPTTYERRTVLIGTVNPQADGYLRGLTSDEDTRYLPVRVGASINLEHLEAQRDQLFAEATSLIRDGYAWWEDRTVNAPLKIERETRRSDNPYQQTIARWLVDQQAIPGFEYITIAEILEQCLDVQKALWEKKSLQMEVAKALRALGWERKTIREHTRTLKVWMPIAHQDPFPPY